MGDTGVIASNNIQELNYFQMEGKRNIKVRPTAPATGNVKMKHVCFRTKHVCFSSANMGVVFSLSIETRRKSLLVPCSVYSWIIHGIL